MFEDNDDVNEDIPIATIPSKYMKDILEYCEHYDFKKDANIPYPLPSNNLSQELADPWEASFIQRFNL